jgi:hypothetical protein
VPDEHVPAAPVADDSYAAAGAFAAVWDEVLGYGVAARGRVELRPPGDWVSVCGLHFRDDGHSMPACLADWAGSYWWDVAHLLVACPRLDERLRPVERPQPDEGQLVGLPEFCDRR